jgi:uncharacterized protein
MVFVAGPRQVGKTTLARSILAGSPSGTYFSWDNREDRQHIRAAHWPSGPALVVLDEIHKWRGWKGWLKGEFDKHRERLRFLVTGSARLDLYRRGSDSLQGRYHHYRLHPFSLRELAGSLSWSGGEPGRELEVPTQAEPELVQALHRFGGFPEPLLAGSERTLRRWHKERLDRFFREDVRDLEPLRDLSSIQLFADLLPERVSSPLSLNAIREDLEVSHRAVTHWAEVLDRLYYSFRIQPFVSTKVRAVRRMPKAYLWDSSLVPAPGPRFENLVALHLLKFCHYLEDREGYSVALTYVRDRDGRELDFLVTVDRRPWFGVEVKLSSTQIDTETTYLRERLQIPWVYQVTLEGERDFAAKGVRVLPAARFFGALV